MPAQHVLTLQDAVARIKAICDRDSSKSEFFPWGGSGYKASIAHYYESSTDLSHAAVQPGSAEDLGKIVEVIAETQVPFAVKCGGHNSNPGFSSVGPDGIQISLARINKITVHEREKLVDVGAGCLFGELYRALEPYNLNIVGGSGLAGVGVAGWMLGGGLSVKTSRHGLGTDNLKSVRIVLPNGSLAEASANQNEDLFFAIKGGGNNFGIVTEFTLIAHDQDRLYYDFSLTYQEQHHVAVRSAIDTFVQRTDNRANVTTAFRCHKTPDGIEKFLQVSCVYDGSFVDDPFQELTAIDHKITNYGSPYPPPAEAGSQAYASAALTETSSFYAADALRSWANGTYDLSELPENLQQGEAEEAQYNVLMSGRSLPITEFVADGKRERKKLTRLWTTNYTPMLPMPGISQYPRGRWGTVMVDKFTKEIIDIIEAEHREVAKKICTDGKKGRRVDISFWPFTKSMFDKSPDPRASAWPHKKDQPSCPIFLYFTWEGKDNDSFWVDAMKTTLGNLRQQIHAISPFSRELPYFVNASLAEDAKVEDLYRDNLKKLGLLRGQYDPCKVMDLTGGFRIPPVDPPPCPPPSPPLQQ